LITVKVNLINSNLHGLVATYCFATVLTVGAEAYALEAIDEEACNAGHVEAFALVLP
jgi:hypothetical protein